MNIDVVITWVDGNDQRLNNLRRQYADDKALSRDDIGGVTRYASIGEIFWCLASINRFAPWVHKIFIVTDQQDPQVDDFLKANFPEGYIPVEIVDHRDIFRGYEQYLPTFNSLSLETMLWRIPGLSPHFIEVNDDVLFASPLQPDDFVTADGKTVCYATRANTYWTLFTRIFKFQRGGKRLSFKENMCKAALLEGFNLTFLKMCHTPKPLSCEAFAKCLGEHPERMVRNIQHRFRHVEQYNAEELHYLTLRRDKRLKVVDAKHLLFFLQPKPKKGYVARKLAAFERHTYKFCCFNGLNLATPDDLQLIKHSISRLLNIHL